MNREECTKQLKKLADGSYYALMHEFDYHTTGEETVTYRVYLHPHHGISHIGWEEALSSLKFKLEEY